MIGAQNLNNVQFDYINILCYFFEVFADFNHFTSLFGEIKGRMDVESKNADIKNHVTSATILD